ncbi:MAG: S9 family peptidase [Marinilabiliales bacterium]|nr:MAG: S9 family peptidase [Marinilabiliales bacterium]
MKKTTKTTLLSIAIAVVCSFSLSAQLDTPYMLPPDDILSIVDAPATPSVSIHPRGEMMLLFDNPSMPGIDELAREELRLAGVRFDPATNGPGRARYNTGISVMDMDGTNERRLRGLPYPAKINNVRWAPDGSRIAFLVTVDHGIELWYADLSKAEAFRLTEPVVNDVLGNPFTWLSDSETLIYTQVPAGRGEAPLRPAVPAGPVVQESIGRQAPARTFQDLLTDRHDEELFEYYATAQLVKISLNGDRSNIGDPAIFRSVSSSPDGNYLMVMSIQRPFSYLVPQFRFPYNVEVWDTGGQLVRTIAEVPLMEEMPRGFGATSPGPRSFTWRNDAPATVYWVEALDGGDPSVDVPYRDQLVRLESPFAGEPRKGLKLELRYAGITWGNDDMAVVYEFWRSDRRMVTSFFNPNTHDGKDVIWDRSTEDRYGDPGSFMTVVNENGFSVLQFDNRGRSLYLSGMGASPEGNRPFVDEFNIRTKSVSRLWRSESPYYEVPIRLLDTRRGRLLTRRESTSDPQNYFIRDLRSGSLDQITFFPDPQPQLRDVTREMIHYEREDGVSLTAELYLPAGYDPEADGPLPAILWAYPREFRSADAAGQVTGSPYTFTRVGTTSVVLFVTQGYAVLNNASFPIVGEGDEEPNDTFVEQLVANAEAAVNKIVGMGVADPRRIAVSGHSYGGFMTANLLSHSDIFAAGIARSAAFNRTMTPFGFQAEERTYWEAPEIYFRMSPFSYAHQVTAPTLLIHGAADNNAGTFPMQSERYYNALQGHGVTTRLVMLPYESHGYVARESILHVLWEYTEWLDRYVKNREN